VEHARHTLLLDLNATKRRVEARSEQLTQLEEDRHAILVKNEEMEVEIEEVKGKLKETEKELEVERKLREKMQAQLRVKQLT